MVKKIGLLGFGLAGTIGLANGAESPDSIPGLQLEEIVVTGQSARQRLEEPRMGAERLELSRLARVPSFAGERDIIKSITLLPGVHSEGDGGGGFEVRGGNATQNLIMLDGMTLYNPSHVMGIFSTFNDNAVNSATLFKGPIPVSYGDATSAVLETRLASGDMEEYHASGTVGILAAKIMAEGPIVKDKLSFAVAARRSYADAFLKIVPRFRHIVMNFYDVSAKLRYRPSCAHIVDGPFLISHDNMAIGNLMGMYWGNLGASVNWVARTSDRITFTTTGAFTHFNPKMSMDMMDVEQVMRIYIHNYSINENIMIRLADNHRLETGIRSQLLKVKSGEWTQMSVREKDIRSLWENAAWIDYTGSVTSGLEISGGVRLNIASTLSGGSFRLAEYAYREADRCDNRTYVNVEPRVSVKYDFSPGHNIKAGFGMASQNLRAIRSSATTFPFDRYALTSADIKPEKAIQYGIGYTGMTTGGDYDWSAEGYYRYLTDVYDYKDGRGSFSDIDLESIILGGKGRSYGAEFMVRKNTGRLTGWISYTISHTQTRIEGINEGKWYDASNDRRHDFCITASYRLTDTWNLGASWVYSSGQPLTAPDVKYEVGGETCYYYSRRNAYMTPATHRLDLAATYTHVGKKFTYEWAFGIYNAYCRYNPYVVYFEDDPSKPSGTRAVQQSMYGIVPSVSYTLKF